jgi:hypothetical protein
MAIIYTYPKLTDPQGNELIVVSDVNNRNATRLITIASIASLVPSGGGCGTAINGILTGAGDYIAPLCNDVTFVGSGVDISADQATATVTFTVPPYELPCAEIDTLGGIKAWPVTGVDPPEPSSDGDYYPVQILTDADPPFACTAVVRVPDAPVLACATTEEIGGIKILGSIGQGEDIIQAGSGIYYGVEVSNNCEAAVRVPEPESTASLVEQVYNDTGSIILKGSPLHINGVGPGPESNPAVLIAAAGDSTLMPVSGLAAEDIAESANGPMIISGLLTEVATSTINGITAAGDIIYVSDIIGAGVPWLNGSQPKGESNSVQNVGIVAKFGGAGVGSIQVAAIGRSNATPNLDQGSIFLGDGFDYSSTLSIGAPNEILTSDGTTASWQPPTPSGGNDQAWSPLSIYEADEKIENDIGVLVQTVAEATIIGMNKIDYFVFQLPLPNSGDVGRIDIYDGTLKNGGTWLGGGLSPGGANTGVETITLQEPINIIAGNKYVIYWRLNGDTFAVAGAKANIIVQDSYLAVGGTVTGGIGVPNPDLATEVAAKGYIADNQSSLARIAHTMYKA